MIDAKYLPLFAYSFVKRAWVQIFEMFGWQVIEPMASDGLRTISLAYRDFVPGKAEVNQVRFKRFALWSEQSLNIWKDRFLLLPLEQLGCLASFNKQVEIVPFYGDSWKKLISLKQIFDSLASWMSLFKSWLGIVNCVVPWLCRTSNFFCSTALTSAGWFQSTLLSFVALRFAVN